MSNIKIRVLGSGKEVGRAAVAVEKNERFILFDYGVSFDERDIPQLPLTVPPSKIDGVFISHPHLDHVGAAPLLYISSRPMSYATPVTKDISRVMLEDFLKLSSYYLPFEYREIENFLLYTRTISYSSELDVGSWKVSFRNAGHLPGSMMISVDDGRRKILYTGDVNTIDTRLVSAADVSKLEADTLIIEGTYGDTDHPDREEVERDFIDSIKEVVEDGGVVLVPSFSLGRSQEILMLLAEKVPNLDIKYDGMIRVITEILMSYRNYINKPELLEKAIKLFTEVSDWSMRRKVWREPGVIVASAGMLKGGPALYYLKRIADKKNSAVFLVSFQGRNTPGRMLLENGVFVENGPRVVSRVQWFDFSSHAGLSGLLSIIKSVKGLEKVIIIHTDPDVGENFKRIIEEELGIRAILPSTGEVIELE
ncbi:MAG: MBL fold metallo-hydrolase [Sulfolobales archaeon]